MLDISSGLYEQREGCDEAVNLRGRIIVKIECPDNVGWKKEVPDNNLWEILSDL